VEGDKSSPHSVMDRSGARNVIERSAFSHNSLEDVFGEPLTSLEEDPQDNLQEILRVSGKYARCISSAAKRQKEQIANEQLPVSCESLEKVVSKTAWTQKRWADEDDDEDISELLTRAMPLSKQPGAKLDLATALSRGTSGRPVESLSWDPMGLAKVQMEASNALARIWAKFKFDSVENSKPKVENNGKYFEKQSFSTTASDDFPSFSHGDQFEESDCDENESPLDNLDTPYAPRMPSNAVVPQPVAVSNMAPVACPTHFMMPVSMMPVMPV
ncbi:unnamed protein product, partial [Polarella glacialis]